MSYVNRDTIKERLALAERDEGSLPLGGTVRLRELTRAELRDAGQWATTTDLAERERTRGALFADAVREALEEEAPQEALRRALTAYYIGAAETATDADRWNAALFAVGVIDGEGGKPLFSRDEIIQWPNRAALWAEVLRLAQAILDLSEVGQSHLKSGDPAPAAE